MSPLHADKLLRRRARLALAAVTLALLAVTLAPFRFQLAPAIQAGGPGALLAALLGGPSHLDDVLNNLLLYLPFGLVLAAALPPSAGRALVVGVGAAALALGVELAQLFLPARTASLVDVAANGAGALLGAGCLWLAERWAASRRALVVGMLAYLAVAIAAAAQVQTAARLDSWDSAYRLLIGNEHNGLRPWAGSVRDLRAAAVALGPAEAGDLLAGRAVPAFERSLVFDYPLAGALAEGAGRAPALVRREAEQGPYLRTAAPVAAAVAAIRAADAFALAATVTPAAADQRGPARIISISLNNSLRNLTIGQEGPDMVVRLRTASNGPNGTMQVLRAPDLLADASPRRILLTYAGARLALHAEGVAEPWVLELIPEAAALSWLAPGEAARALTDLPAETLVLGGWLLVHGLIGLPLGAALAWGLVGRAASSEQKAERSAPGTQRSAFARGSGAVGAGRPALPELGPWGVAALLALLLPLGFELLLAAAGGRGVRLMNSGAEATFALGALVLFGARAGYVLAPRGAPTAEVPRCR